MEIELLFLVILLIGGIFIGLYASSVGGGSIVAIPLLLLIGLPIHIAIATNRLSAVFLEFSSTARFFKEKQINVKHGLMFGFIAALGSFIGSHLVINVDEKILSWVTAFLLLSVFIVFLFKKNIGIEKQEISNKNWIQLTIFTFLLGIYGGFIGAGFGTFLTFMFVLTGFNFVKSAALSRIIGTIMSLVAAAVFAFYGMINYPYAISLGFGMAIGAWVGAGISINKGNNYIRVLFIVILLLSIVKLIMETLI